MSTKNFDYNSQKIILSKSSRKSVIVIALDGVPYSFFPAIREMNLSPVLSSLHQTNKIYPMTTTLPPVSSVAWASFLTGVNPGAHGLTGFVDRKPGGYEPFVPTAEDLQVPTIYQHLSRLGLRVCSLGVPATFPPVPINGILVSGFLAPNVERSVYPLEEVETLKSFDYELDIDAWSARESDEFLIAQLPKTLSARINTANHYLNKENWDLFVFHILETDRLHHFMWRQMKDKESKALDLFSTVYGQIDTFLQKIMGSLSEVTAVIILSDHGFTELKKDFYLNRWLLEAGYLSLTDHHATNLTGITPGSKAFSMAPGRIYLHFKGKAPHGTISNDHNAEALRKEISQSLENVHDPETGFKVIKKVADMREEWDLAEFDNSSLQLPDLIAIPSPGYELKGDLSGNTLFGTDRFSGMHSYGDAFVYLNGEREEENLDITDMPGKICSFLGVQQMKKEPNLT